MIRAAGHRGCAYSILCAGAGLSYAEKNLVAGEMLVYQTRHHWIVLLGPLLFSLLLEIPGMAFLVESAVHKASKHSASGKIEISAGGLAMLGLLLLAAGGGILFYGLAKRNATEMAVTNKRVLIKTGLADRRTLDLMLSRVESIGVEETFLGRILGYGSVIVRGTGGTPEAFFLIARPQEFRRAVQEQTGRTGPTSG
jgi:PH (Pleckstrin Homology) domain-containing protein